MEHYALFTHSSRFWANETISGFLQANLKQNTPLKYITIQFFGIEDGRLNSRYEENIFYRTKEIRILDVKAGEHESDKPTLDRIAAKLTFEKQDPLRYTPAGIHQFPFSIKLPPFLPGSVQTATCSIRYLLQAIIHYPKRLKKKPLYIRRAIYIKGSLWATPSQYLRNLMVPVKKAEQKSLSILSKNVHLIVELPSRVFQIGGPIYVQLVLNNPSSKSIVSINVELVQRCHKYLKGKHVQSSEMLLANRQCGGLPGKQNRMMPIQIFIPRNTPESLIPVSLPKDHGGGKVGKILQIQYYLNVKVATSKRVFLSISEEIHLTKRNPQQIFATSGNQYHYSQQMPINYIPPVPVQPPINPYIQSSQETQKVQQNALPSCPPMVPPTQDIYDPNVYAVPFDYYVQLSRSSSMNDSRSSLMNDSKSPSMDNSRSPSMNELKDALYPKLDAEPRFDQQQSLQQPDSKLNNPNVQESIKEEVTSHHQDASLDSTGHAKTLSQIEDDPNLQELKISNDALEGVETKEENEQQFIQL